MLSRHGAAGRPDDRLSGRRRNGPAKHRRAHARQGRRAEQSREAPRGSSEGHVVIDQLSVPGHVTDFGLRASGGEIVAIAGQVGSGASEVLRALAGLTPDARGHVSIAGRAMRLGAPQRSIQAGAVFASNDRKSEGLFLRQSVARNLLATRLKAVSNGGVLNRGQSSALAQRLAGLIGFDRKRSAQRRKR